MIVMLRRGEVARVTKYLSTSKSGRDERTNTPIRNARGISRGEERGFGSGHRHGVERGFQVVIDSLVGLECL
jgi:hypothetical protein